MRNKIVKDIIYRNNLIHRSSSLTTVVTVRLLDTTLCCVSSPYFLIHAFLVPLQLSCLIERKIIWYLKQSGHPNYNKHIYYHINFYNICFHDYCFYTSYTEVNGLLSMVLAEWNNHKRILKNIFVENKSPLRIHLSPGCALGSWPMQSCNHG